MGEVFPSNRLKTKEGEWRGGVKFGQKYLAPHRTLAPGYIAYASMYHVSYIIKKKNIYIYMYIYIYVYTCIRLQG